MVTLTNTSTMDSSALVLGLISKDTNIGSIDTNSFFNWVGAVITCDNDNTVNNNVSINNGTNDGNGGGDTPLSFTECFESTLTPAQIQIFLNAFQVETVGQVCLEISGLSAAAFLEDTIGLLGIDEQSAQALVDCLVEAGVLEA